MTTEDQNQPSLASPAREDDARVALLDEMLNYSSAIEPLQIFVEDGGVILEPPIEYAKANNLTEVFVAESLAAAIDQARAARQPNPETSQP